MATDIRASLSLVKVDELIYTSSDDLYLPVGSRGLFGGQILGQALVAATNCVPEEYALHSTHVRLCPSLPSTLQLPCRG